MVIDLIVELLQEPNKTTLPKYLFTIKRKKNTNVFNFFLRNTFKIPRKHVHMCFWFWPNPETLASYF